MRQNKTVNEHCITVKSAMNIFRNQEDLPGRTQNTVEHDCGQDREAWPSEKDIEEGGEKRG